jgi:5'-nucleotidase / UDP-sugar diphosphatase
MISKRTMAALTLMFGLITSVTFPLSAEPTTVTFLHTNDVYEITAKRGKGGLARLAYLLNNERRSASHAITTFGGDLLSPSVMSGLTKGAQMIELLNAIGMDMAVLGNHEYDFGPEVLDQRVAQSKFPWLASNVFDASGKHPHGTQNTRVIQAGDYKVGFFGVLTPETESLSSPGPDIRFADVIETAKASVAALKDQGADVIVALTHLDFSDDRLLARSVKGINLILGGHDHEPVTFFERGVMIFKAGHDAHFLGAVDLTMDYVEKRGKKKLVVDYGWRMVPVRKGEVDADVQAIVDRHEAALDEKLNIVIGTTSVELDSRRSSVRSMETNMGNLIAEAMMVSVGADVGMTNGGGIRGNRTYDAGTKLTRRDILSELPFGNVTVKLEMTGSVLLETLENGVSKIEDGGGRFPQISGMRFVYDPSLQAGSRVVSVNVGGKPLDPKATYTMATNDYSAGGGDGYSMLKQAKNLIDASAATYMATDVMNHIEAKGTIAPTVDGRISTP